MHVAHCIFILPNAMGYAINYGFGLLLSSEYMLLLVAGGFLIAIPPYLIAEWLSNRKSFSQCLVSPESSHDQGTLLHEHYIYYDCICLICHYVAEANFSFSMCTCI